MAGLSAIKGTNFTDEARQVLLTANGTNEAVNPVLARVLQTNDSPRLKDVAAAYNIAARKVVEDWNAILKTNKSPLLSLMPTRKCCASCFTGPMLRLTLKNFVSFSIYPPRRSYARCNGRSTNSTRRTPALHRGPWRL